MKIRELYEKAVDAIAAAGIPDADLEATFLLGHLLKMNRARLLLSTAAEVPAEVLPRLEEDLARRCRHEPLAYIIGEQEFWSLPFKVSPAVLIPRPETEFLLETALRVARGAGLKPAAVLDLGVGSGAISVVLARELPAAHVFGVDLSFPALKVARANVRRHGVVGRVHLVNSDLFQGLGRNRRFDLVVSNPPYVDPLSFPALQPEVVDHEPRLALSGGERGLAVIRSIAAGLPAVLRAGGWLFMEIGADQGAAVLAIFAASAKYDKLEVYQDYAGKPRVLQARMV